MLAMAQVTITTNELPYAGMSYAISEDTVSTISPGNPGTGQVWDFTQLQFQGTDTITFENAALSPYTAQFPNSNLVAHNEHDSVFAYYTTNQNGFYLDGSYEEAVAINAGFHFAPPVTIIPVPFTMGDSHISHAVLTHYSTGSGTAFKLVHHQVDTLFGDGTGMLKVPGTVYSNTLRIRIVTTIMDSIFMDMAGNGNYVFFSTNVIHNIRYSWFRQGAPSYLLGIEVNFANPAITERIEYADPLGPVAGIKHESDNRAVRVFPNPASQFIRVKVDELNNDNLSFKLFSPTGQNVIYKNITADELIALSPLDLTGGLYYYQVLSGNLVLKSGKLIIEN